MHFEDLRFLDESEREQEFLREEELASERGEKRKEKEEVRKLRMKERRERHEARKKARLEGGVVSVDHHRSGDQSLKRSMEQRHGHHQQAVEDEYSDM